MIINNKIDFLLIKLINKKQNETKHYGRNKRMCNMLGVY